jgi:hypothetical protein
MGTRAARMCAKCYALATHGKYCERHKDEAARREREYKASNPLRKQFNYNCKAWRQTRAQILADDPQCAHVDPNGERCPLLATDCHHKIRAEEWVAKGGDYLDMENLEGLCKAHHSATTAREVGFAGWNKSEAEL